MEKLLLFFGGNILHLALQGALWFTGPLVAARMDRRHGHALPPLHNVLDAVIRATARFSRFEELLLPLAVIVCRHHQLRRSWT